MIFGIDNFISKPPLSMICGILLLSGIEFFGKFVQRNLWSNYYRMNFWLSFQNAIVGILFLSILLFPIALFGFHLKSTFRLIGYTLICSGVLRIFYWSKRLTSTKFRILERKKSDFLHYASPAGYVILFLYFLVTLAPVTNADSLHYHIGVAIELLNLNHFPVCEEWFHCRLAGSGEVLNALGLLLGSEQFGALLQFSGLVSIYGLVRHYSSNRSKQEGALFGLVFLLSPVLLFLVPSSKPQLYPIALTSLAFVLLLEMKKLQNKKFLSFFYFFALALLMVASTAKVSFELSLAILGLMLFYFHTKGKCLLSSIFYALLFLILVKFPFLLWKILSYKENLFSIILTPLPGFFLGKENFLSFLRSYSDSTFMWPLSMVIPNSIGGVSTILGLGIIIPVFIRKSFLLEYKLHYFFIIIFIVLAYCFGQSSSRFYLEPMVWLLILSKVSTEKDTIRMRKIRILLMNLVTLIQFPLVLFSLLFGVYVLTPGGFSLESRELVMKNRSNGYDLFFQLKNILPSNSKIVSDSLSTKSLSSVQSLSFDWYSYTSHNKELLTEYLRIVKEKEITHVVFGSGKTNFENCIGNKIFSGISHSAHRNPFNRNEEFPFYVAELKYELLPDCYDFSSIREYKP